MKAYIHEPDSNISCLLHRVDGETMKRFYLVTTGPSLLEPYAVLRFWGRMGGFQREMVTPCASPEESVRLARQLIRKRLRRGYRIVGEQISQEEINVTVTP
jgi:predicted DNA-binding WGR domain protein